MRRGRRFGPWLPLAASSVLAIGGLGLEAIDPRGSNPTDPILVPLLLTYAVAAGLIGRREPRNSVWWVLGLLSLAMVGAFAVQRYAIVGFDHVLALPGPEIGSALGWLWMVALACPVLLAFVIPTGRPLSPVWRRVFTGVTCAFAGVIFVFATGVPSGTVAGSGVAVPNPIYIPALKGAYDVVNSAFFVYVGLFAAGAAALAVRFRRSRGVERQQLKWILFGIVGMLAGITASNTLQGLLADVTFALGMLPLPISLAVAILRYRLYDIDLVIKRTVSYAALSALLLGLEVGGIVALQGLLSTLVGGRTQTLAVAITTLGVAALFHPARRRIQGWVDRRFDRSQYDAEQVLAAFAGRLREEISLDHLADDLTGSVTAALQPASVSIWVRERERGR